MKQGHKIDVVRFNGDLPLGKSLDMNKSLGADPSGVCRIAGIPVDMAFFDSNFMEIRFKGPTKDKQYGQLIPWSAVATVIFSTEAPEDVSDGPKARPTTRDRRET